MVNPLNLPEILTMVGHYLVYWISIRRPRKLVWTWHPHPLVCCLRVSKTWNIVLTPVLWYCCSAENLRFQWTCARIPRAVFCKNSHHFRILRSADLCNQSWIVDILEQCRNLRVLEVEQKTVEDLELVRVNPRLSCLVWKGDSFQGEDMISGQEEKQVLSTLTRLTDLDLVSYDLAEGTLITLLINNPRLARLFLTINRACITLQDRFFDSLQELDLKVFEMDNLQDIEHLVQRCRRLQSFKLTVVLDPECNLDELLLSLAKCLGQSCPELSVLAMRGDRSILALRGDTSLASDAPLAALIGSMTSATSITLSIPRYHPLTTIALIQHKSSLKELHLTEFCKSKDARENPFPTAIHDHLLLQEFPHLYAAVDPDKDNCLHLTLSEPVRALPKGHPSPTSTMQSTWISKVLGLVGLRRQG